MASRITMIRSLATAFRTATRPGAAPLTERAASVPRLVKAAMAGEYRATSLGKLALMGGAALYLLSPVDLLPEGALFALGLADDTMVATWLAAALVNETESFLAWEKEQNVWRPGGATGGPQDAAPASATRTTVPGTTVPGSATPAPGRRPGSTPAG
ncbi:YkvA family protein [Actinomycetota bacterium]